MIDNGVGMDIDMVCKVLKGGFMIKMYGIGLGLGICRYLFGVYGVMLILESELKCGMMMWIVFLLVWM